MKNTTNNTTTANTAAAVTTANTTNSTTTAAAVTNNTTTAANPVSLQTLQGTARTYSAAQDFEGVHDTVRAAFAAYDGGLLTSAQYGELYNEFAAQANSFVGLKGLAKLSNKKRHYAFSKKVETDDHGQEAVSFQCKAVSFALDESDLPATWADYKAAAEAVFYGAAVLHDGASSAKGDSVMNSALWRAFKRDLQAALMEIKTGLGAPFFVRVNNAVAWAFFQGLTKKVKRQGGGDACRDIALLGKAQVRLAIENCARDMLDGHESRVNNAADKEGKAAYKKAAKEKAAVKKAVKAEKPAAKEAAKKAEKPAAAKEKAAKAENKTDKAAVTTAA